MAENQSNLWICLVTPPLIVRVFPRLDMLRSPRALAQFEWAGRTENMREIQVRSWYNEHTHEWSAEINGTLYESLTREELLELLRRAASDLEEETGRLQ